MSYVKKTLIKTTENKYMWMHGHCTNPVVLAKKKAKKVVYSVFDNSGHGRGGDADAEFTANMSEEELQKVASKA